MNLVRVGPIRVFASLLWALPAVALADDAREWLSRMEQAVETLSYEGTFVHMVGNSVETMHVIHRAVDGQVDERLFSRDQPGREILRHNDKVTCIFSDQRTVLVERRKGRHGTPLLSALAQGSSEVERWYEFSEAGEGRKLGRAVNVIEVRPRDVYRYGHRLWLDQLTAMPLKVQLLDHQGIAVEQIQFVSMMLPAEISDARLQPEVEMEGFTWFEHDRTPAAAVVAAPGAGWAVEEPPPGFRLTESRVRTLPGSDHPVEHLVYSDGLASVSVFVEPADATDQALSGLSRMGAAHAFTLILDGQQITAVGEVPPNTVERIARSLRAAEAPAN
ncbi:MAG: MucB/RseB C-terminal domain-containing protein [Gammaproteobacteria bacterium]